MEMVGHGFGLWEGQLAAIPVEVRPAGCERQQQKEVSRRA
jgi:hypothetical protein